jgi:hypothetical protein
MDKESKWQRYNSFSDLTPEKQKELLSAGDQLKENADDTSCLLLFVELTQEWLSVPKTAIWSVKWGLKEEVQPK